MNTIDMFERGSKWLLNVSTKAYGQLEVHGVIGNVIMFVDENHEAFPMSLELVNRYGIKRI